MGSPPSLLSEERREAPDAQMPGDSLMTVGAHLSNRLLASLSPGDFSLISPMLIPVALPKKRVLQVRGQPIEYVYFLDSGVASVVIGMNSKTGIEVGVVGREGVTGLSLIMGASSSPYDTIMQAAGSGWQLSATDLRQVMIASRTLQEKFILFCHTQCVQMAYTILANGRYTLSQRLARWLLMAQDRVDSGTVPLTHGFLSVMLGVRRAGVTVALNNLEKADLIRTKRGAIRIENREGLKVVAKGSYGAAEDELKRYFPLSSPISAPKSAKRLFSL
jgi:CRP-like cAMP-binding protein